MITDEDKLIFMFEAIHGKIAGSCHIEIQYDDDGIEPMGINVIKNKNIAWSKTKLDILFDYMTRNLI